MSTVTGGVGFIPYVAGVSAATGVSIGLDAAIRDKVASGALAEALHQASYHVPFLGTGHSFWEACQQGDKRGMIWYAGLTGVEVLGLRGALKGSYRLPQGAAKQTGVGKIGKGASAAQGAEMSAKQVKGVIQQSWKASRWNIGEAAVNKKHHNWHKIFGDKKPTLDQIKPYVKEALKKGEWKDIRPIMTKGSKGVISGTKVELVYQVGDHKIWVLGKRFPNGEIIINNAGVN